MLIWCPFAENQGFPISLTTKATFLSSSSLSQCVPSLCNLSQEFSHSLGFIYCPYYSDYGLQCAGIHQLLEHSLSGVFFPIIPLTAGYLALLLLWKACSKPLSFRTTCHTLHTSEHLSPQNNFQNTSHLPEHLISQNTSYLRTPRNILYLRTLHSSQNTSHLSEHLTPRTPHTSEHLLEYFTPQNTSHLEEHFSGHLFMVSSGWQTQWSMGIAPDGDWRTVWCQGSNLGLLETNPVLQLFEVSP